MDALGGLWQGFAGVLGPHALFFCFVGVVLGQFVGVLPGLGPAATIAMLLPLTFRLDPATSVIMLGGVYYGTMYGGSITSILLRVPGEAASAVTAVDGYEMARRGRAGAALGIAAFGSFIAGTLGVVALGVVAPPLARLALAFGPPEQCALMLVGLTLVAYFGGRSMPRALAMACLGLLLGTVGLDPVSAAPRFTGGLLDLADGLELVAVVMGLFGIAEVAAMIARRESAPARAFEYGRLRALLPTAGDWRDSAGPIARGTVSGFLVGVIPGGTGIIASFASYAMERRWARNRARLGQGAIEGVAGPESANNAAAAGAYVPLLTLGLPGNPAMAMLLGAFIVHGVVPGPLLLRDHPQVFWSVVASMYVGNLMLLALNVPLIGIFVRALRLPPWTLVMGIVTFCLVGAYAASNNPFGIYLIAGFGALGYVLPRTGYDVIPLVLGVILGPPLEAALRQSLMMAQGRWMELFTERILVVVLLALALAVLASGLAGSRGLPPAPVAAPGDDEEGRA